MMEWGSLVFTFLYAFLMYCSLLVTLLHLGYAQMLYIF